MDPKEIPNVQLEDEEPTMEIEGAEVRRSPRIVGRGEERGVSLAPASRLWDPVAGRAQKGK